MYKHPSDQGSSTGHSEVSWGIVVEFKLIIWWLALIKLFILVKSIDWQNYWDYLPSNKWIPGGPNSTVFGERKRQMFKKTRLCYGLQNVSQKAAESSKGTAEEHLGHGPLSGYVELWVALAQGMPGTFPLPSRVSDLDMHHGTCVTHVRDPCRDRYLTVSFEVGGESVLGILGACQDTLLRIW